LQWQIGRISNFRDENSNGLHLQGRKTYLSLLILNVYLLAVAGEAKNS